MTENEKKTVDANLSRLFDICKEMPARFAHQAHELSLLLGSVSDVDSAYGIINEEYLRTRGYERCCAFIWLRVLSEVLCASLTSEVVREHIVSLFSSSDERSEHSSGKVSYLRNKFTEKAFDKFAKHIDDAKIMHADSFEDSCMDTYNGICEYCILPTENSKDGKLTAFYKLIEKYDLHICASTTVKNEDVSTTVSLLSRDIGFTHTGELSKGRIFEFGITCPDPSDIGGILSVASAYGMKITRIDTRTVADGTGFTVLMSTDGVPLKRIETLTFCLSAIYPAFTVMGFYKHIN